MSAALGLVIVSCTNGGSGDGGGTTTIVPGSSGVYQGAGSKWKATFTATTFVIEYFTSVSSPTADVVVNGTYVEYSTGFRKLTVTSATGTSAPAPGVEAYGFNIPGFAFLLKPIGDDDSEIIVMLEGASCPTAASFNANWIIAKFSDSAVMNDSQDVFGTASFTMTTPASSTASIDKYGAETAISMGNNTVPFNYNTCASGTLNFDSDPGPGVDNVDMFFTSNGGALVHAYDGISNDSIIFAAPKFTGDVTQADLTGTYSAVVFDEDSAGDKVFPAKWTIPASGASTANRISDIATDATLPGDIEIGNFTTLATSNGLFNATIDPGGDNGRLNCAHFALSGKKSIVCNGYGSAAGSRKPFFFLARER